MASLAHYKLIDYSKCTIAACAPLKLFNITYFNYIRVFPDGRQFFFGNHASWLKHFFENKYYLKANFSANPHSWTDEYYFWHVLPVDGVLSVAQQDFDIDHGITIIDHYENYTDFFLFASARNNSQINNFYLNNLELLRHFINYFKDYVNAADRSKKICNGCENSDVRVVDLKKHFYEQTKIIKYHLNYKGVDFSLSPQQHLCLKMLGQGLPLKLIAQELDIKTKTCQFYLDNIKDKLGCINRVDLLSFIKTAIK